MFGLSMDSANELANKAYIVCGIIAIVATALALIASFVMWRTSDAISAVKDARFEAFKLQAETKISENEKQTAEAKLQLGTATKETESLKLSLVKEENERLQLQKVVQWRNLSREQIEKLRNELATSSGNVYFEYPQNNDEAFIFVNEIASAFPQVNWSGSASAVTRAGEPAFGVFIPDSKSPVLSNVRLAFQRAGIAFSPTQPRGQVMMSYGQQTPDDAVRIIVGNKPPTSVQTPLITSHP